MLINGPVNLEDPLTSNNTNGEDVPIPTFPSNNVFPVINKLPNNGRVPVEDDTFPFRIKFPKIFTFEPIVCVPITLSKFFNIILLMSKSGQILMA